ncbi:hypothetical protein E2562_009751 [Oryza meyeriana var. granulata]|uniref:Uncharacterized protein n=1 Tax=Oryza meyeriana var. granulata TaxID=110450 RepID=A0A6G1D1Y2_9ORYZ|nr:hypothetical protein E2562_009751 [Oryza meyeriana var. granulata]
MSFSSPLPDRIQQPRQHKRWISPAASEVLGEDQAAGHAKGWRRQHWQVPRHPAGLESPLNTRVLESFAPVESEPNMFRCTLQIGLQVAPGR